MVCFKCKIANDQPLISCDGCVREIHCDCSDLSASEMKVMALKGKRILKFYCNDCQEGVKLVPKLLKKIEEMEAVVNKLKDQPIQASLSEETIIDEIYERQKRANNVMVFNLPESHGPEEPAVEGLFKEIAKENLKIVKTVRLGNKNKNGFRALKVVMHSQEDASKIIRARKLGKDNLKGRRNYIGGDLTHRQVETISKLKEEVDKRKKNGEQDIFIKYIKGVPIISKNARNN